MFLKPTLLVTQSSPAQDVETKGFLIMNLFVDGFQKTIKRA